MTTPDKIVPTPQSTEEINRLAEQSAAYQLQEIPEPVRESTQNFLREDQGIDANIETIIVANSEKHATQISTAARLAQIEVQLEKHRAACHSLFATIPVDMSDISKKSPVIIFFREKTTLPGHFREDYKSIINKVNETLTLFDKPTISP